MLSAAFRSDWHYRDAGGGHIPAAMAMLSAAFRSDWHYRDADGSVLRARNSTLKAIALPVGAADVVEEDNGTLSEQTTQLPDFLKNRTQRLGMTEEEFPGYLKYGSLRTNTNWTEQSHRRVKGPKGCKQGPLQATVRICRLVESKLLRRDRLEQEMEAPRWCSQIFNRRNPVSGNARQPWNAPRRPTKGETSDHRPVEFLHEVLHGWNEENMEEEQSREGVGCSGDAAAASGSGSESSDSQSDCSGDDGCSGDELRCELMTPVEARAALPMRMEHHREEEA